MAETIKSFLRPLRNLLLSSSFTKEEVTQTPSDREIERNIARIKGFTYLKSMNEIFSWDEQFEDALQRSNIPLRSRHRVLGCKEKEAKTMIIHDFGSAYHDFEASNQCIGVDEPQLSLDAGQMQFTETFVYFAHYLVSSPPPSWIEWCHINGVECLGTFIIEPQMSKEEVGRIFETDEDGRFVVARRLGEIARWVGFEGWIVNIEGMFPVECWDVDLMVGFLRQLKEYGTVVWYVYLPMNYIQKLLCKLAV